jgi:large subunit ribosomal protein L24
VKLKIKKGATVQVIAGSDKGKSGKVLEIKTEPLKIKVQGVKVQTHFDKKEGLLKKEGFIDYSNVKLVAASEKATKTKAKKKATKNA